MSKFKNLILYLLISIVFILVGWFLNVAYHLPKSSKNPIAEVRPTPLYKYSIENLANTKFESEEIQIGKVIKDYPKFTSYEFSMRFNPDLSSSSKTTSGLINIPKGNGPYPLVVMFRGYVDQKIYTTGVGTQHAGEIFANNGFITVAPDFLGYGSSDSEAGDIFESRFQTYVTAATILKSIPTIKEFDQKNIFIWGHSNGGQVALITLEITGADYPTVLWAPVSKPFPFSILFYTDESNDHGKFIRQELARFESDYDVEKFSLTNYFDKIKAPIQLHQGTADDAVPVAWSDLLAKILKKDGVNILYIKHPRASHDMVPGWDEAVTESLQFFQKSLTK